MTPTNVSNEWTIMMYLAGDNDLSDEMVWTLTELFRVTMPKQVAVTVQFDPLARGSSTRSYQCVPEHSLDIDGAFRLEGNPLIDTKDANLHPLVDFIKRSVEQNQAKNYALILSGHGSGIEGDFLTDYASNGNGQLMGSLKISDLRNVFKEVNKLFAQQSSRKDGKLIDILGMDSCLMSMAEVAYQVKDHVRYLVGSEGFVQATGWPYYRLFHHLQKHIVGEELKLDVKDFAISLVHRCTNYYADYNDADISFDMAACDLEKIGAVQLAVNEFVEFVRGVNAADTGATGLRSTNKDWLMNCITLAHWKAQSYKWEVYTDLWDFFNELALVCRSSASPETGCDVKAETVQHCERINGAVQLAVECAGFAGPEFQHSHGISIYFPWSQYDYVKSYEETEFAKATKWHEFLIGYFEKTQRRERKEELYEKERREEQERAYGWRRFDFNLPVQADPPPIVIGGGTMDPAAGAGPAMGAQPAPNGKKTHPPFGRVFDLAAFVGDIRSGMKNPARKSKDYLMVREKIELDTLKKLRQHALSVIKGRERLKQKA